MNYLETKTYQARDLINNPLAHNATLETIAPMVDIQAQGFNVVIVCEKDDPFFHYCLTGDADGSITIAGNGSGSVVRSGNGWGDAEKLSSGFGTATNHAKSNKGPCCAVIVSIGNGDAYATDGFSLRMGGGKGDAVTSFAYELESKAQLTIQSKVHSDEKTIYGYMLTFEEGGKSVERNWLSDPSKRWKHSFESTLGMGLREAMDHKVQTLKIFNANTNQSRVISLYGALITNKERMGKLIRVLGESETQMEHESLIEQLVEDDMERHEDNPAYLEMLLRNGFIGYQNQSFKELKQEWDERLAVNGNDAHEAVRESE